MAFEWMHSLPASMRAGFLLWGTSLLLFGWIIWEEQTGVEVHKSRSKAPQYGYWGVPTSNIDWCEDNYVVTSYVAEFYNAMSSFSYLLTSMIGSYLTLKYKLENRFLVCFASIFVMGLGSIAFHSTLLRTTQMLDEIPLIFSALTFVYILNTMQDELAEKDPNQRASQNRKLSISLLAIGAAFTAIYFLFPENPAILQGGFVGLVCYVAWVTFTTYIKFRVDTRHPEAKQLLEVSMLSFTTACLLWLLEPRVCQYVGWMNLHAWWHLLSCYGVYLCVLFYKYIRLSAQGKRPSVVPLTTPTLLPSVMPGS